MPRPRFHKLDSAIQQRILEAAAVEFAANGFHDASYNHIIAASGVSKGSFYYYFDDKEDLFFTIMEEECRLMWAGMEGLWEGQITDEPFWDQVEAMLQALFERTVARPRAMQLAKAGMTLWSSANDTERLQAFMEEGLRRTQTMLELGQVRGEVREDLPTELLTGVLMGLGESLDRVFIPQLVDAPPDSAVITQYVQLYLDLIRRVAAP